MKSITRKVIMLFIVTVIIALYTYPVMATDVGGIIVKDTTWTSAGSPYNIISNVQIAEGIVLTVEPGVVISNGNLQVWGSFNAVGTTSSTIILNSVNLYSESNSALINIKYSELNYVSIYQYDGNLVLEDSEINYLNQFGISGVVSIERNAFIDSSAVRVNNGIALIRNNLFFQQTDWAIRSESNTSASDVIAELNSFLSTDRIAVRLDDNADITALNNYWGTTDPAVIESMIYDGNDYYTLHIVEYIPFRSIPHPDTPIPDFNQAPTSNCGDDQAVNDQVTLNGTGSTDPDGSIFSYYWSLQHRTNSASDRDASGDNPTVYNLNPGFYDVYLTVTDDGGLVGVDNMLLAVAGSCFCTPSTVHIEMIEPDLLKADRGAKHGQAHVKVLDDCGNAVSGVTVYGTFSGDFSESRFGQTGGDGNVLLTTTTSTKRKPAFTFCVDDVSNGTLSYAPDQNVETSDSY